MFSASCLGLQRCFASIMPTKVLKRSQRTHVGTSNMFLCPGHVNLSHTKSSPTNTCEEKSSLSDVWVSKDILTVSCPQRSSEGLKGHMWAFSTCFCALDMRICPTEKVLQPKLVRKKVLCLMYGSPRMFCQFHAHKGPQKVSKDTCGHFQCVSVPWTCEFVPHKKLSNQHLLGKKYSDS